MGWRRYTAGMHASLADSRFRTPARTARYGVLRPRLGHGVLVDCSGLLQAPETCHQEVAYDSSKLGDGTSDYC